MRRPGRGRPEFDLSLAYGEMREGEFGRLLAARGDRIEVKSDDMSTVTGNLFVELRQRGGQPSGLMTTRAEWYAFRFGAERWFVVSTTHLRTLARRAVAEGRVTNGGDNDNDGALVPVGWLVK